MDLAAPAGAITALVGPNGAGKTTTLRLLAGLAVPAAGEIRWRGTPAAGRWELTRRVGFAAAEPRFPAGCRVRDLVRLRAALTGADGSGVADRVAAAVGRPLAAFPHELSRGQRLRLAVELALLGGPEAVVLDEPWAGLEPLAVEGLLERLSGLAAAGVAVLVSSHDLFALPEVAHRYVFLVAGRVRAAGTLEQLREASPCPQADPTTVLRELYRRLVAEA